MSIRINLDVMMAKRKMGLTELAGKVDITLANLSILKNGKAKAVRLSTLNAICKALQCQPGDIFEYVDDGENESEKKIPCTHCSPCSFLHSRTGGNPLFCLHQVQNGNQRTRHTGNS